MQPAVPPAVSARISWNLMFCTSAEPAPHSPPCQWYSHLPVCYTTNCGSPPEYNRNPFESIKSRLKTPESIYEKLERKGHPVTLEESAQTFSCPTISSVSSTSFLYFSLCSRLAQKSMAMVRNCTSTRIYTYNLKLPTPYGVGSLSFSPYYLQHHAKQK